MNPFSRFLRQWSPDEGLDQFVVRWDELEALVIRVYKQSAARPEDEAAYATLRPWIREQYQAFRSVLAPHWRAALVGGQPAKEDPFLHLLRPEKAAAYIDNWPAMQNLPAAREALNRVLLQNERN
jgi:hypothetical protein